jgi:hypothetical protein
MRSLVTLIIGVDALAARRKVEPGSTSDGASMTSAIR